MASAPALASCMQLPKAAHSLIGRRPRNVREAIRRVPFRIRQQLLDTSIYLYPDEGSAADGARVGGSGFIVGLPLEGSNGAFTLWAVTNRHVIEQGNSTIRLNRRSGGFVFVLTDYK